MARPRDPIVCKQRSDSGAWLVSLRPECGLPANICREWTRRSFSAAPEEWRAEHLARDPRNHREAMILAQRLVDYLKPRPDEARPASGAPTLGSWMRLFLDVTTSPRARRLVGKGRPYSPKSIANYGSIYRTHLAGHVLLERRIDEIAEDDLLELLGDIARHEVAQPLRAPHRKRVADYPGKPGPKPRPRPERPLPTPRKIEGTRAYEAIYSFVRMVFREYQLTHKGFRDPFFGLERPRGPQGKRGALEEGEVVRLFSTPGVFDDQLERAVCTAIFWAGFRRAEVFALRPDRLDWRMPKIHIDSAWKNFDRAAPDADPKLHPIRRELGDPKHHKIRDTTFPEDLQREIRELWRINGQHEFVFAFADGSIPTADWWEKNVEKWFHRAGIDTRGRKITPHSARHSMASVLEAEGVPLRYIQEILGHSDLKTTLGYLQTPSDAINRITRKIDTSRARQDSGARRSRARAGLPDLTRSRP